MKNKTLLKQALIKVAKKLSKEYNYKIIKDNSSQIFLSRDEKNSENRILVRERFGNLRLDVYMPTKEESGGFVSVEYNVETMTYSESQLFYEKSLFNIIKIKNMVENELNIKSNIKFDLKDFKTEYLKIDKYIIEKYKGRFLKYDLTDLIYEILNKKYNLQKTSANIAINKELNLILNFEEESITIERYLKPGESISRDLARINHSSRGYHFGTAQIFHNEGFELFQDLYNAIIEAKIEYIKNKLK